MDRAQQLIFGIHPVLEKLRASPAEVEEVIIAEDSARSAARSVDVAARQVGVRVKYGSAATLDRLAAGQRHQGVVAKIAVIPYMQVARLLETISSSGPEQILILDGLTDPHNFGALLRTAEAVGIRHVIIPKDRSVGVTAVVVKASAGAVHHLKIYKATNLRRAIKSLKDQGFWVAGLDVHATDGIYDRVLPERLGIVLGSEGAGIRPLIRQECDFLVSIPMAGKIASLNVAVAGAVFLYELVRQKQAKTRR
jgi:23S rRNA (guanosine2251-2'-O)-methyltransferase